MDRTTDDAAHHILACSILRVGVVDMILECAFLLLFYQGMGFLCR